MSHENPVANLMFKNGEHKANEENTENKIKMRSPWHASVLHDWLYGAQFRELRYVYLQRCDR